MRNPALEFEEMLHMMGEAGQRLTDIGSSEGAAGNISICMRWLVHPSTTFPVMDEIELPQPVSELAGAVLIVSGSGVRLREILANPSETLACLVVNRDGISAKRYTSPLCRFDRLTSEFNSHLAVHHDRMLASDSEFHAIVHAQPLHLTFLSHIPPYGDERFLNTHLMRWQPETILNLPQGIGFIPFRVPGSSDLTVSTVEALKTHALVIWAKHGVVARSDSSILHAVDLVEYAETAARYEYLNLSSGESGEGLSAEEIRGICRTFNVRQDIF